MRSIDKVLEFIRSTPGVSYEEIMSSLTVSKSTVKNSICTLKKTNLIYTTPNGRKVKVHPVTGEEIHSIASLEDRILNLVDDKLYTVDDISIKLNVNKYYVRNKLNELYDKKVLIKQQKDGKYFNVHMYSTKLHQGYEIIHKEPLEKPLLNQQDAPLLRAFLFGSAY